MIFKAVYNFSKRGITGQRTKAMILRGCNLWDDLRIFFPNPWGTPTKMILPSGQVYATVVFTLTKMYAMTVIGNYKEPPRVKANLIAYRGLMELRSCRSCKRAAVKFFGSRMVFWKKKLLLYWQFSHSSKVLSLSFVRPQVDEVFFPVKLCFKVFLGGAEGFTKWYVSHVHVETSKYEASHPTWLQHRSISRRTHSSANSFRRRKSTEQQESCISKQKQISNQRCFLLSDLLQGRTKWLEWCILHISILHGKFLGVAESPKILGRYMPLHVFFGCNLFPMQTGRLVAFFRCVLKVLYSNGSWKMHDESTRFSHLWHFIVTYFSPMKNEPRHFCLKTPKPETWRDLRLNHLKDASNLRRIPGLLRFVGQFRFCLCDLLLIEVWKPRLREMSLPLELLGT